MNVKVRTPKIHFLILMVAILLSSPVTARAEDNSSVAQLIYSRITGVKESFASSTLTNMTSLISQNKLSEAVDVALNSNDFYNTGLFQYFAPLSNRNESPSVVLNDFIADGIANTFVDPNTKQDRPYTNLVSGDFTVKLNGQALSLSDNNLLSSAASNRVVLTPTNLTITSPQRPNFPDAAGVLTSRQFMAEHAMAGTNRRIVQFAFREFLCTDIKEWQDDDPSISDGFVTRDVDRAPGGGLAGAQQYQSQCRSCHQMQDGLRTAFAFHDFDSTAQTPIYISNTVAAKINQKVVFAGGFVVSNDAFENKATQNSNAQRFGWRGPLTGNGAKAFGAMIAKSFRFSTCAVEKVFQQVCKRPLTSEEQSVRDSLAQSFEANNYSLRGLFKSVVLTPNCVGLGG
jgi:hypothetical protein